MFYRVRHRVDYHNREGLLWHTEAQDKVSACCLNPWVRPASSGKYGLIELSPLSALMGPSKLVVPALSEDIPVRWYKEEVRSTTSEMRLEALLAIG